MTSGWFGFTWIVGSSPTMTFLGMARGQGKEESLRSHTPTVLQPSETRAKLAPPTSRGEVLLLGLVMFLLRVLDSEASSG